MLRDETLHTVYMNKTNEIDILCAVMIYNSTVCLCELRLLGCGCERFIHFMCFIYTVKSERLDKLEKLL